LVIGIVGDTWGISFRKLGSLLAQGLDMLGYKAMRYIDARIPLLPTGKWTRMFLIGDTVYTILWGWHRYHAHFCEKCIFWTDSPIDLEHIPDSEVEFVNEYYCPVAVTWFEYIRMRNRGFKVYGVVGRPLNSKSIKKALETNDDTWRKKYGKYILTIGGDQILYPPKYPRKGLDRFDEAIGLIKPELKKRGIKVVAVSNWVYFKNIDVRIPLGSLPEDELYQLIKQAELFVFPSRLEAFGVPPLEAMALGKVVVHANAPAYNEFTIGLGIPRDKQIEIKDYAPEIGKYWHVYDYPAKELADLILYALDLSEEEKKKIGEKAMEKAKEFYDYKIAQKLLEV